MTRTATGLPDDEHEEPRRLVGEGEVRALRAGDRRELAPGGEGAEPDPPQRPRRATTDIALIIAAMTLIGGYLLLYVNYQTKTWLALREFVTANRHLVVVGGVPGVAFALLAVALFVRARHRP